MCVSQPRSVEAASDNPAACIGRCPFRTKICILEGDVGPARSVSTPTFVVRTSQFRVRGAHSAISSQLGLESRPRVPQLGPRPESAECTTRPQVPVQRSYSALPGSESLICARLTR